MNSVTTGQSNMKINENHWSLTKGTSKSDTWNIGGSIGSTSNLGLNVGPLSALASMTRQLNGGFSSTTGSHEEKTAGGSRATHIGQTSEVYSGSQSGKTWDTTNERTFSVLNGKDVTTSSSRNGGNTTSLEKSRQEAVQKAEERAMQVGAQSMFLKRQSHSSTLNFNWEKMDSSMWREEREDTEQFTCAPMNRCKMEQVYGTCGNVKIGTRQTYKFDTALPYQEIGGNLPIPPMPPTSLNKPAAISWDIKIPGETWIVAKDLSFWKPSGRWENLLVCPPDTVVTGHSLKRFWRVGLTGITLSCTPKFGRPDDNNEDSKQKGKRTKRQYLRISPGSKTNGTVKHVGKWGPNYVGSRQIFAEGFSVVRMELNGRRSVGNFEVKYQESELLAAVPHWAQNSSRVNTSCPLDHAICGVTAMLDQAGKGIITGLGFKCCHHCVPREKWISVLEYTNRGISNEHKHVRTIIGLQRTNTEKDEESSKTGNTIDSAGISRGFAARFGRSNYTGFDWSQVQQSVWTNQTEVTEYFVCEAGMHCTYKVLVGECGSVRIPVNKFEKKSEPLNPPPRPNHLIQLDHEPTPVEILHNGQIWVEALDIYQRNLNLHENVGHWGRRESCPLGTFVTGYTWHTDNDGFLNKVSLECSRWGDEGEFVPVSVIQGENSRPARGPKLKVNVSMSSDGEEFLKDEHRHPIVGLHYFQYQWTDNNTGVRQHGAGQHSFIFDPWVNPTPPNFSGMDVTVTGTKVTCPSNYVVCGLQTLKDKSTGVLNELRLQCCYHCEPTERLEQLSTIRNAWDTLMTKSVSDVMVGAAVQVDKSSALVEGSKTLRAGVSDHEDLMAMFAHRLPNSSKNRDPSLVGKFDWKKQSHSLWTRESRITVESRCGSKTVCTLQHLVGSCNKLKIPTSYTPTVEMPLD